MSRRHFINGAIPTTTTGAIAPGDTSFSVTSLSSYPASLPYALAIDADNSSLEVVLVTAVTGNTVTACTRGYDGTAAQSHASSATVEHVAIAMDYDEANSHVNASSGVHGITGAVVGTTDVQTLTNKTAANLATTGTPTGPGWVPIGGIVPYGGFTTPPNWQLCDGTALSRSTYATLFSSLQLVVAGCTTTNGSANIGVPDSSIIAVNSTATPWSVTGTGIQSGSHVNGITGPTGIVLNKTATATGTVTLTFYPHGNGDGSTTFNVPNLTGRFPMGAGSNNYATSDWRGAGGSGGQDQHDHGLTAGYAEVVVGSNYTRANNVTTSTWSFSTANAPSSGGSQSGSASNGAQLGGRTDESDFTAALPKFLALNHIIRVL